MKYDCLSALERIGIQQFDALALRRISSTLKTWFEKECGSERGAIERDQKTGKPFFRMADARGWKYAIRDRETGARKRLAKIMSRYPGLTAFVQTDPRGCALYILRPSDMIEGADISSYYSRGIPVYRD